MAANWLLQQLVKLFNYIKFMLRPLDREFANRFKNLESELNKIKRARQPYFGDWLEILEPLEYTDSNTVSFRNTAIDAKNFFSVGDKVRFKQTGDVDYRYMYVVAVENNSIDVIGGTDFDLDNLAILEFGRGLVPNPVGHPVLINFDADIRAANPSSTYSNLSPGDYETTQFFMIGSLMLVRMDVTFMSMSGGTSSLHATPPTPSDFLTYERRVISCTNAFNFATGLTKMGGPNLIEIYTNSNTLAGFQNTTNGAGFNISLEYAVD